MTRNASAPRTITGAGPETFGQTLSACPFRALISTNTSATADQLLAQFNGCAIFSIESPGEAIDPQTMQVVLECVAKGQTVIVAADRREARDHLKQQILAWMSAPQGRA